MMQGLGENENDRKSEMGNSLKVTEIYKPFYEIEYDTWWG